MLLEESKMLLDDFEQNKDSFMESVQDSFEKICIQNKFRRPYSTIEITDEDLESEDPYVMFSLIRNNIRSRRGEEEIANYQCMFTEDGVTEEDGSLIADNLSDFIDGVAFYMADKYDDYVNS